jgi:arylformamidase
MPDSIIDISLPIDSTLPVWPGDPQVDIARVQGEDESGAAVSHISMGSHTGTHVDAPAHIIPAGATVDQLPIEVMIGPAWVAYLPGRNLITGPALAGAGIPGDTLRLLLRTNNSASAPSRPSFDAAFAALTPDAADWILQRRIRLVGIDGPSIEPYVAPGTPVHRQLLGAGVVILENLALTGVNPGAYDLICLPLRVRCDDGAPVRAVLVTERSVP